MKRKTAKILAITLTACTIFSGCSNNSNKESTEQTDYNYLKDLEKDTYYVHHSDKTYEKVLWTDATFEQSTTTNNANNNRIVWFTEDTYQKIPTLYSGDSLLFKTSDILNETFYLERFEDFGYSVGLCKLTETQSGRYSIYTDPEKNNTFPGGDTDELLKLGNKTVIIDTLGGVPLRVPTKLPNGISTGSQLSRIGSINGLEKDKTYTAEVYEGTTLYKYDFTANVRIMASMQVVKSTDFSFESETVINIAIPESFNSGYYMINGVGLFRYVKGENYDENTNFNVPNEETTANTGNDSNNFLNEYETSTSLDYEPAEIEEDISQTTFELTQTGIINVQASIAGENNNTITSVVYSPSGTRYVMSSIGSSYEVTFEATETGIYTIEIYNLGEAQADINVTCE